MEANDRDERQRLITRGAVASLVNNSEVMINMGEHNNRRQCAERRLSKEFATFDDNRVVLWWRR